MYDWRFVAYTEGGDPHSENVSKEFTIPTSLYTVKTDCKLTYCVEGSHCDLSCWNLYWKKSESEQKLIDSSTNLLPEFITLAKFDTAEDFGLKVEKFAQKWGSLDLCKHLAPASHNPNCKPLIPHKKVVFRTTTTIREFETLTYCEPLSAWKKFATYARAILNVAANISDGDLGNKEDWDFLHHVGFLGWSYTKEIKPVGVKDFEAALNFEKRLVSAMVNNWLMLGGVKPEIEWKENRIAIRLATDSPYGQLFTQIALQIMFAIAKQDGVTICSACCLPYTPKRKPVKGKRRFCEDCVKLGKPQLFASADYRSRKNKPNGELEL